MVSLAMKWLLVIAVILLALALGIPAYRWVRTKLTAGPDGDWMIGVFWRVIRLYVRVVHHVEYTGLEHVPPTNRGGPLIVVSNHTSAVDPLLIQAAFHAKIRWFTAEEYMAPGMMWFWNRVGMLPIERSGRDSGPLREAIRYVREGGVVGVFPEGGIANPPRQIRPFIKGMGLIIARTKAPVLLIWVSDTPHAPRAMTTLFRFSNARVRFVETLDFSHEKDAGRIVETLRRKLAEASGWPLNDELLPTARRGAAADPFGP